MTAIKPSNSELRDQIQSDEYNETLNVINAKYAEMDKFIGNLESDIQSVKEFEKEMLSDQARGYDVGSSLDTLGFQKDSLEIDLGFFVHMKGVYIKKLYGDLYKYCDGIIDNALAIEEIPTNTTKKAVKERKFRNMVPYPAPQIPNPKALDSEGNVVEGEPETIPDPNVKYDMNEIFALINCTTANLRELADDIGSFQARINNATEKEARGFNVGNLIMNLEAQKQKLTLEFKAYIDRLKKFLDQNKNFSDRCLKRIQIISNEIVTADEQKAQDPSST
jgi:predicted AlkP superfamily phosphohydrolase/phosphomutase